MEQLSNFLESVSVALNSDPAKDMIRSFIRLTKTVDVPVLVREYINGGSDENVIEYIMNDVTGRLNLLEAQLDKESMKMFIVRFIESLIRRVLFGEISPRSFVYVVNEKLLTRLDKDEVRAILDNTEFYIDNNGRVAFDGDE